MESQWKSVELDLDARASHRKSGWKFMGGYKSRWKPVEVNGNKSKSLCKLVEVGESRCKSVKVCGSAVDMEARGSQWKQMDRWKSMEVSGSRCGSRWEQVEVGGSGYGSRLERFHLQLPWRQIFFQLTSHGNWWKIPWK